MRWWTAAAVSVALAGCAPSQPLWPGPDWQAAAPAAATAPGEAPAAGPATTPDESPVKVPKAHTLRGSGTPTGILFPTPGARPTVAQPVAPPPLPPLDTSNPVLSPRNPNAPYGAQGYGYQREGPIVQGPNGAVYNQVGPTSFGTGANAGQVCHAVGTSLFCN